MTTRIVGRGVRPAVLLAPVERRVGVAVEEIAHRARGGIRGDADRQRERRDPVRSRVHAGQGAREHATGDHQARLDVGVRQDDREFVAADAVGTVATADRAEGDATHRRQQLIAERVSLLVVDLLQVVHVHEQQRERRPVTRGLLELAAELLLERAVVPEAGQAIEERVLAGLTVEVHQAGAFLFQHRRSRRIGRVMRAITQGTIDAQTTRNGDREAVAAAGTRPEPLHRGDAHEQHELDRQHLDDAAADVRGGRGAAGGRGVRWLGHRSVPIRGVVVTVYATAWRPDTVTKVRPSGVQRRR